MGMNEELKEFIKEKRLIQYDHVLTTAQNERKTKLIIENQNESYHGGDTSGKKD